MSTTEREAENAGFACGPGGCLPITRKTAEALWAAAKEAEAKRDAEMPDEITAVRKMTDAFHRLQSLGWRESQYAPKGKDLHLIEAGSSGIHEGYRDEHGLWIVDGDCWPSRAILFRLAPAEASVAPLSQVGQGEQTQ